MIRMNEMTWMEFKAKIDEGAITILPIGACEQHGPHLGFVLGHPVSHQRLNFRHGPLRGLPRPHLERPRFLQVGRLLRQELRPVLHRPARQLIHAAHRCFHLLHLCFHHS